MVIEEPEGLALFSYHLAFETKMNSKEDEIQR